MAGGYEDGGELREGHVGKGGREEVRGWRRTEGGTCREGRERGGERMEEN